MEQDPSTPCLRRLRNIVCFFLFGLTMASLAEVLLVAAQDLLSGSSLATTTVILALTVPSVMGKLAAPWFMQKFPYSCKVPFITVLYIGGLLVIFMTGPVEWRLLGASAIQLGCSLSEISFLALTSFYPDVTVNAFTAGLGGAALIGPLYYTGKQFAPVSKRSLCHISWSIKSYFLPEIIFDSVRSEHSWSAMILEAMLASAERSRSPPRSRWRFGW